MLLVAALAVVVQGELEATNQPVRGSLRCHSCIQLKLHLDCKLLQRALLSIPCWGSSHKGHSTANAACRSARKGKQESSVT